MSVRASSRKRTPRRSGAGGCARAASPDQRAGRRGVDGLRRHGATEGAAYLHPTHARVARVVPRARARRWRERAARCVRDEGGALSLPKAARRAGATLAYRHAVEVAPRRHPPAGGGLGVSAKGAATEAEGVSALALWRSGGAHDGAISDPLARGGVCHRVDVGVEGTPASGRRRGGASGEQDRGGDGGTHADSVAMGATEGK